MNKSILGLAFVLLVGAGFGAWFFFKPDPHRQALHARELATRGLAEYLGRTQPGRRVLIVSNPFTQRKETAPAIVETEEAGIRGVRLGLDGKSSVKAVVYPDLQPAAFENPRALIPDAETTTPLSYLVTPDAFDKLVRQNADCDILVSLIGLPATLDQCEAWRSEGAPKFALLLPELKMVGDTAAVLRVVKSGKLVAFVVRKPGGLDDQVPVGKDVQAEFDRRFILVTAENIEQVLRQYPGLF